MLSTLESPSNTLHEFTFSIQTEDYSLYQTFCQACFILHQTCPLHLLTPIIASIICKYQAQAEVSLTFTTYVFISTAGSFCP
jgi:hypothetical protein